VIYCSKNAYPITSKRKALIHSNDSRILASMLGHLQPTLLYIQQHPSVLEAAMIMKIWRTAVGSWSFTMLKKSFQNLFHKRDRDQTGIRTVRK